MKSNTLTTTGYQTIELVFVHARRYSAGIGRSVCLKSGLNHSG